MSTFSHRLFAFERPGLLVSVRNAVEAMTAVNAGADVIDIKEPKNGSLGAASLATICEVVAAVAGRAMVTAAMGELRELVDASGARTIEPIPGGVALFKIGLSGSRQDVDWQSQWHRIIHKLSGRSPSTAQPVAVVYADWEAAGAPDPHEILGAAITNGCPAILVDTWDKSSGALFQAWRDDRLLKFVKEVKKNSLAIVLAGSLRGEDFTRAVAMRPDLVAVRGAACESGRDSDISYARIVQLKYNINKQSVSLKTC